MLAFKRLHLNLLNIVVLLTLKAVLGDYNTRLKTISTIFKSKFVKVNPQRNRNIVVPIVCDLSKQNLSQIIHQNFGHVSIYRLKRTARKVIMEAPPENLPDFEEHCPISLLAMSTKITRGPNTDVLYFAPGFMLQMDSEFLILKAYVYLPRLLWLYILLLCTRLYFHPEANVHILTSSNCLSLH